jgi:hypothetical protein
MKEKIINQPKDDFSDVDFGDKRLNKRLSKVIENSTKSAEKSILSSSGGRSEAKAFYRLLSNDKFDISELSGSAYGSTLSRLHGIVLLIQDTSDINLNGHRKTSDLGYCSAHIRGIKLHSCIAVSPDGMPFGLMNQEYHTRAESKSAGTKTEKVARSIEEKESYRWLETMRSTTAIVPDGVQYIVVCDREGDFYELYAEASELETDFVIRVTHDRICDTNELAVTKVRQTKSIGSVTVNIPRDSRRNIPARTAEMKVACCQVNILKPANVNDTEIASPISMNLVRIAEINTPDGHEPIEWILSTSLPIDTISQAMTIVEYYIQRWKIERFHFTLKSGLGAEKIQQRTYERIKPVLLIYSVIALFIMAVTYAGKLLPDAPCTLFLDDDEWKILYRVVNKTKKVPAHPYSVVDAVSYLSQIGGFKRSPSDGSPGLPSIWKGLFALYYAVEIIRSQE